MEQNRKRYSSLAKAIVIGLQMIAAVGQKIQATQNYRKPQQNSCIQRQYPFAGHLLTPF